VQSTVSVDHVPRFVMPASPFVIPAKAGIQGTLEVLDALDSRLRGNDAEASAPMTGPVAAVPQEA
jgi:hypothetical protein